MDGLGCAALNETVFNHPVAVTTQVTDCLPHASFQPESVHTSQDSVNFNQIHEVPTPRLGSQAGLQVCSWACRDIWQEATARLEGGYSARADSAIWGPATSNMALGTTGAPSTTA